MNNRVIALIDMDCFYCQVEVRLNPSLQNKPLAVVQYNTWKGGGIIAVNYEARDRGVTRHMRGDEAKSHCPDIELVHVPSVRGKADLTKYRDAGREVAAVLCENCKCVERASIDEAYLDLTEEIDELFLKEEFVSESQLANTFIVGYAQQGSNDECGRSEGLSRWLYDLKNEELDDVASKRLALGARIIEEIRASVYKKTGFRCSAGIAHNKIMAKVVCGLHKPNRQTVLPSSGVAELFSSLPVQKVRNLGGKFGSTVIDTLGCKVMADLARFSERELQSHFDEKTGTWLYNIARGIDLEPVTAKLMSKSIGCCKKFPGRSALSTRQDVMHWLSELSSEISDRLDEDYNLHKRRPLLLTASVQQMIDKKKVAMSKSSHISAYDMECIMQVALAAINKTNNAPSCSSAWQPPLLFLGISVRKFVKETSSSNKTISYFFKTATIEKCAPYSDHHTVTQQGSCTGSKELSHNVSRSASNPNSRPETGQNSSSNMKSKSVSFFERYLKTEKSENSSEAVEAFSDVMEKDNEEDSDCDIFDDSESSDVIGKLNGEVKSENNVMEVLTVKKDNSECDMFDGSIRNIGKENNLIEENMVECNGRVDLGSSKDERQINCSNNGGNAIGDMISDGETSWISPSEIFPDINNLDDSLVQLMPSPFIKKLKSYEMKMSKNNEGESNEEQCDNEGVKELDEGPSTSVAVDNINAFSDVDNLKSSYKVLENESNELDSYQETMIYPDVFKDTDREIKCDQRAVEAANKSGIYDFPVSRSEINIENEISELCPHCKESVRLSEFPEHLDHHIALDLHKSLNSSEVSQAPKKRILDSTESKPFKKKRGQPSTKEKITEKQKQTKSILSFFSRK